MIYFNWLKFTEIPWYRDVVNEYGNRKDTPLIPVMAIRTTNHIAVGLGSQI